MTDQRHPASQIQQDRRPFYRLAAWGICHGWLTTDEVKVIARPGTRKGGYWGRHLHDLKAVIAERQADGERQR